MIDKNNVPYNYKTCPMCDGTGRAITYIDFKGRAIRGTCIRCLGAGIVRDYMIGDYKQEDA